MKRKLNIITKFIGIITISLTNLNLFITKAIFDQKNIFHPNRYLRGKAGEPIPHHWEVSERHDGNKDWQQCGFITSVHCGWRNTN